MRSMVMAGWAAAFVLLGPAPAQTQSLARITTSEYVQQAAMSDLFEIEASKLAVEKADGKAVKAFAEQMVKDHGASLKMLGDAVARTQTGIRAPSELDGDHKAKLALLRNASGIEFDKLYVDLQANAHDHALKLHSGYAADGDNEDLKTVASQIKGYIEHHVKEIREIQKAVPKS